MQPGNVHEHIRDQLESFFTLRSWNVEREVPIRLNRATSFGDLLAVKGSYYLLMEIENDSRRVANDIEKSAALSRTLPNGTDSYLWIITPNNKVSAGVRRKLQALRVTERHPWLAVLTLPAAIKSAEECDALFFL